MKKFKKPTQQQINDFSEGFLAGGVLAMVIGLPIIYYILFVLPHFR
jgi:hypothetical protein